MLHLKQSCLGQKYFVKWKKINQISRKKKKKTSTNQQKEPQQTKKEQNPSYVNPSYENIIIFKILK